MRVQRKTIGKLSEERANVRDQAAIASRIASDRSRRWYKFNWTNHKAKKKTRTTLQSGITTPDKPAHDALIEIRNGQYFFPCSNCSNYPQSARCKKIQEEMEALQFELAQKNMQIQSLQYDLYKLKEKYDNETKLLKNEVEWGLEKVGSLKLEMKRLKEPETDDTISIMR